MKDKIDARCHMMVTANEEAAIEKETAKYPFGQAAFLRMVLLGGFPKLKTKRDGSRNVDVCMTVTSPERTDIYLRATEEHMSVSTYLHSRIFTDETE